MRLVSRLHQSRGKRIDSFVAIGVRYSARYRTSRPSLWDVRNFDPRGIPTRIPVFGGSGQTSNSKSLVHRRFFAGMPANTSFNPTRYARGLSLGLAARRFQPPSRVGLCQVPADADGSCDSDR